jgi:hypothetical protein
MLGQSVEHPRWVRRASVWACHGDARREYWRRTTEGFSKIEHFDPVALKHDCDHFLRRLWEKHSG